MSAYAIYHKRIAKRPQAVKKQKAYKRKNIARFTTTAIDVGYPCSCNVHSQKKRTKRGILVKRVVAYNEGKTKHSEDIMQ